MTKKTILITGASRGIGLYCALALKARGYRVFAGARHPKDVDSLRAQGLEGILLDIDDSNSIKNAVNEVLHQTQGTLDVLFNNAGFGQPGAIEDLTRDTIRKQFETNVFGLIELTNLILPTMRKQGHGRIINMSSLLGLITLPYRGAYNASKYALEGFTDTLRQELHKTQIHVALIEPGPIDSNFRRAAFNAYQANIKTEQSPHQLLYKNLEKYYGENNNIQPTFTQTPAAVYKKLRHAIESKHPKVRYYVGIPAHIFIVLKRILPANMMDWVLRRISDK